MKTLLLGLVGLVASTAIARADVELKNDGFASGGNATFQTGFVAGEAGAARFVAPAADRQLHKIQLLFGGGPATQTLTLKIYDDTAGTDAPGGELFEGDFELTGSDSAIQELDVTSANIFVTAQFRVAIVFQHAGAPSIATDADATVAADKNFILVNGTTWRRASELGVTGDWVIRAFISDGGSGPQNPVCDTTADCPAGNYCDEPHHACTFDCHTTSDCTSGAVCNDIGQCEGGGGHDDGGGCQTGGGAGLVFAAGALALLCAGGRARR